MSAEMPRSCAISSRAFKQELALMMLPQDQLYQ